MHFGNKTKGELLEQARLLRSLLNGDGTSLVAQTFEDLRTERAYKSFIKSPFGIKVTREEYKELLEVTNKLNDLFKDYGSTQFYDIIDAYKKDVSITTIGDIIQENYTNALGKGNTPGDLVKSIVNDIKNSIGK